MTEHAYEYFMGTLSNKKRLAILRVLMKGSKNVTQIYEALDFNQTTVSRNLQRLEKCGFVNVTQKGKERVYSVNKETIAPLMKLMEKHVNKYCRICCVKD